MDSTGKIGSPELSRQLRSGERGQSTPEWIGLVLLIAVLLGLVASAGLPGPGIPHAIARQILCAASLTGGCAGEGSLDGAYGRELASLVRAETPTLMYGRDMLGLPVDFRTCRSPYCADGPGRGEADQSTAGEPVTLFTRVIDCRDGEGEGCGEDPAVYIQYWAYYPESASLRGLPVGEEKGYHPNDWESVQIRIGEDGEVAERASSHSGYNHRRSPVNWGSDMGWGLATAAAEAVGLREHGGWGRATGQYLIAGGSHAGNVADQTSRENYPSWTPAGLVRLVPLETVKDGPLARPADFDPITPPWEKKVWTNGEETGTG